MRQRIIVMSNIEDIELIRMTLERESEEKTRAQLPLEVAIEAIRLVEAGGVFVPKNGLSAPNEGLHSHSLPVRRPLWKRLQGKSKHRLRPVCPAVRRPDRELGAIALAGVIAAALLLAGILARAAGLRADDVVFIAVGIVPGAVIGGRLGYLIVHSGYYGSSRASSGSDRRRAGARAGRRRRLPDRGLRGQPAGARSGAGCTSPSCRCCSRSAPGSWRWS